MCARVGRHNARTVYIETDDGRSFFVAAAMSDGMAKAIEAALNGVPPGRLAVEGCPEVPKR